MRTRSMGLAQRGRASCALLCVPRSRRIDVALDERLLDVELPARPALHRGEPEHRLDRRALRDRRKRELHALLLSSHRQFCRARKK